MLWQGGFPFEPKQYFGATVYMISTLYKNKSKNKWNTIVTLCFDYFDLDILNETAGHFVKYKNTNQMLKVNYIWNM